MSMQIIKSEIFESSIPLVSVDIITYNHEKYASKAIEGVLMQKTDFLYEIVICDDFSTDNTREILLDYQKKYPDKIILRFQEKNVGLRYNYFENKKACRGKYIAICEGDDYWTDPNKLQMQVDFLENNHDYSMTFTNSMEVFDFVSWNKDSVPFSNIENRDYIGSELLLNWLVPTATVLFRNNISFDYKYLDLFLFFDIPLFLRLSEFGKIRGFNENTAVYRRHENAITNQQISDKKYFFHLKALNKEFSNRYRYCLPHLYGNKYYQLAKAAYKRRSLLTIYYVFLSMYYDSTTSIPLFKMKLKQFIK